MDARHFDRLARTLSEAGTRRGLLGLVATLPLLGGLFALIGDGDETEAKGRRKRRKKKRKHGKGRHKGKHKKKPKCKPKSLAQTCQGKCGQVKNNCKKMVDCGPCGCDPACAGDPEQCCDGACVDTDRDPDHCGTCGQSCAGDTPVCWNGSCVCGDVCASGCPFTAVQAAIDAAGDGDTLRICAGSFGAITITKNLTLIGAGDGSDANSNTLLDAAQQGRVVETGPGVTATLQGLRITGGQVTDTDGAGILNRGQLTMTDCTVTANHAVAGQIGFGSGGGIVNYPDANLTMTDCTISQNSAAVAGGGILLLQGTHILTNCTFTGNTADDEGGALLCDNGGATTLVGCTIGPDNDAPKGAIVVWNNSTQVILDASTVSGNSGTTVGGINNVNGVVTLQNGSTVSGNNPSNCVGTIIGSGCAA